MAAITTTGSSTFRSVKMGLVCTADVCLTFTALFALFTVGGGPPCANKTMLVPKGTTSKCAGKEVALVQQCKCRPLVVLLSWQGELGHKTCLVLADFVICQKLVSSVAMPNLLVVFTGVLTYKFMQLLGGAKRCSTNYSRQSLQVVHPQLSSVATLLVRYCVTFINPNTMSLAARSPAERLWAGCCNNFQ